jgi:hypothetical protein
MIQECRTFEHYCVSQGPTVVKVIFGSLRGFAGQISPAAALDAVSSDNNTIIVDIRLAMID